jgi:hypothetical protein
MATPTVSSRKGSSEMIGNLVKASHREVGSAAQELLF